MFAFGTAKCVYFQQLLPVIPCVHFAPAKAHWCFALVLVAASASALDPAKTVTQYHMDVWTERHGLPQGSVQVITQTRDGYLWIGTRDGLARFDGVAFTVFRAESHAGLGADDIRALKEDSSGRLWIGTFNGGLSSYANGRFTLYTRKDGLPGNGVFEILEDSQKKLWFGTRNGLVTLEDDRLIPAGTSEGSVTGQVFCLRESARGEIWIVTDRTLYRMVNNRAPPIPVRDGLPRGRIRELLCDPDDTLWLATTGPGLWHRQPGRSTSYSVRDGLPDDKIRTLLRDRNGNLWIGTWSGLCRFQDGQFSTLTTRDGLPHDYVDALYEDREGSLWIGTRGGGLGRLRDGKFSNFTTREGLAHNFAKCVFEDRDGDIWMGTHGGGVSRYRNGQFAHFTREHGLRSLFVWALAQDRSGDLWIGTGLPASVAVFKEERFVSYGPEEGLVIEGGVRAIFSDAEGSLWIGGDGGGLCQFRHGSFTTFTVRDGLPSNSIRLIGQDREGRLWIGTNEGLCRYENGRFTTFEMEDGLPNNTVYAMHQDPDGAIWFGTQGGLARYAGGKFRAYTARDGLFQNVIYQILEDRERNFWMSSNRGIFEVPVSAFSELDAGRTKALKCIGYGVADGMKATQCEGASQPAGWRSRDGRMWFPTASGVTMIQPAKVHRNERPPPVLLEQVFVDGRNVGTDRPLRVSPGTRELRFRYTALSFLAPSKVNFRYRLEPFDRDWVEAGTRREAFYNGIPAGKYRFRVIACNDDGLWNETGASFAFYLPPHFYQTGWFIALCVATVGVAAWNFHRRRMARARTEFSVVLAERSRIARALHDTLAQGFAGIAFQLEAVADKLDEAPTQARQHLDLALSMVRHSLVEARRSVMNLRSASLENRDLAGAMAETARQMIAHRPVDVEVQTCGPPRTLPPKVEDNLLRVGQEAVTNALKHSQATQIRVVLDYQPDLVRLSVHDNGCGFDSHGPATVSGARFGLIGMRERAKQSGGRIEIRSSPGTGTDIVLEISTNGVAQSVD